MDGVHWWSLSDGTAVFACARPGGTKHCFGYFVIVALMLFGLRNLMSHRMALSCWCGEIADHQVAMTGAVCLMAQARSLVYVLEAFHTASVVLSLFHR